MLIRKSVTSLIPIDRELLLDPTISFFAKGLYAYIAAFPIGHEFDEAELAKLGQVDEEQILAAVTELRASQYLPGE